MIVSLAFLRIKTLIPAERKATMKNSEEGRNNLNKKENDEIKKINRLVSLIVFFLILLILLIMIM